jgi:hypothetical protein
MTGRSVPWRGVFHHLKDLAETKIAPAEYAMKVLELYDVLAEDTGDPAAVRDFLLFQMSLQHDRRLISKKRRELVVKLLPKPPRQKQKRGRPKGALGDNAYRKRHQLYVKWTQKKALNPSLTKEQFAKEHLSISDEDLKGEYSSDHRTKVVALLQELKPARMKHLDEGQRRALETIYPLVITFDQHLARQWREAKQRSPALTKEDFLQDFFGWPRDRKRHPIEIDTIREFLEILNQGEMRLTDSERG